MSGALLRVEDVRLMAGASVLLDGIELSVAAGEVTAILGANGAGKSSLIDVLSASVRPDAGRVLFEQRPLAAWTPRELAMRRALNAGEPAMPFAMRADECVALGRPFDAADLDAINAAMDETHAAQWAARDFSTLSSGEQMRVQIARALYQLGDTPRCLWLLDEPCAHLDLAQRQFVLSLIQRIARSRQWAVVFSSHDPAEAAQIADQALLLRNGRTVAVGSAHEVLTEARLSECYGVNVIRREAFAAGD